MSSNSGQIPFFLSETRPWWSWYYISKLWQWWRLWQLAKLVWDGKRRFGLIESIFVLPHGDIVADSRARVGLIQSCGRGLWRWQWLWWLLVLLFQPSSNDFTIAPGLNSSVVGGALLRHTIVGSYTWA